MIKNIASIATAFFIAAAVFSGCDSSARKVEDARTDLENSQMKTAESKQQLQLAIEDSTAKFQKFRTESQERISTYEKDIADIKLKIQHEKKVDKAKGTKLVAELEKKTVELKQNLKDYKEVGKDKWEAFEIKFNNEMDELGKTITNFFSDNKK